MKNIQANEAILNDLTITLVTKIFVYPLTLLKFRLLYF